MFRVALAGITAHAARLLSTSLAIVLAVAFVTGTLVYGDTLERSFSDLFGEVGAGIDVQVAGQQAFESTFTPAASGPAPVPDDVVEAVAAVDGVAAVEATYTGTAQLLGPDGEPLGGQGPPTTGVDAPTVAALSTVEVRAGRFPEAAGEIALDAASAEAAGFAVGDEMRVAVNGPVEAQTLVGTFGFPGRDDVAGATVTMFDDATARELYGQDGAATVDVLAAEGVEREELRDRVAAAVGADYTVLTGEEAAEQAAAQIGEFLGFITTALLVFAGVSLVVAAFLIFNTFTIVVAQRTRELALLRAIGAGRGQVLATVLVEALVVGVVGSALGLLVGIGVALGLRELLAAFGLDLPSGDLVVAARTPIAAMVVGPLVTVVAALVPALRATRVAPLAALRDVTAPAAPRAGWVRLGLGVLLLALGSAGLALGLVGNGGLAAVGAGALGVLLGVAVLSALAVRPVARVLGAPVAAARGMAGTLARENTVRNPRRTAATAAALMIGLGLVSFVLILSASLQASVDKIVDERFRADFTVQPRDFVGFPSSVAEELAGVEGVGTVTTERVTTVGVDGVARTAAAIDPARYGEAIALDVTEGDLAGLADGQVALDGDLAADLGVGVGDVVPLALVDPDEERNRTVAAVYDLATTGSNTQVLLARQGLEEAEAEAGAGAGVAVGGRGALDSVGYVLLAPGVDADTVRGDLEAVLADYPSARLADAADLREEVRSQTDQLLGLVTALLLLSVVIALFGITNTLALSVLERTRELGLLRAVGMSRSQTRVMVRWEAVMVSLLGAVLGLVVGVFFGVVFTEALEGLGLSELALPTGSLAVAVVLAGLAGVVAAVLPARRASRVDVLRALAVE